MKVNLKNQKRETSKRLHGFQCQLYLFLIRNILHNFQWRKRLTTHTMQFLLTWGSAASQERGALYKKKCTTNSWRK